MIPVFSIEEEFELEGRQCYTVRLNTACCKGLREVMDKDGTFVFLENGEECPSGFVKRLKMELRNK